MIVYRLEDHRCRGAFRGCGIWCSGPGPDSDDIPDNIWMDKRYHYAAPALEPGDDLNSPRGLTEWFDASSRKHAIQKGLRVAVLDVSDAHPYVTQHQVLFFRDQAIMLDALHPVTLRSIGWHPSYDAWMTGP